MDDPTTLLAEARGLLRELHELVQQEMREWGWGEDNEAVVDAVSVRIDAHLASPIQPEVGVSLNEEQRRAVEYVVDMLADGPAQPATDRALSVLRDLARTPAPAAVPPDEGRLSLEECGDLQWAIITMERADQRNEELHDYLYHARNDRNARAIATLRKLLTQKEGDDGG